MRLNYNRNAKKIVRPKKPVSQPVAFADTNLVLNGCKVMVAHPDATLAQKVAGEFREIVDEYVKTKYPKKVANG